MNSAYTRNYPYNIETFSINSMIFTLILKIQDFIRVRDKWTNLRCIYDNQLLLNRKCIVSSVSDFILDTSHSNYPKYRLFLWDGSTCIGADIAFKHIQHHDDDQWWSIQKLHCCEAMYTIAKTGFLPIQLAQNLKRFYVIWNQL